MARYHMTDEGPKKCDAGPGNCPVERAAEERGEHIEHYPNKKEADKAWTAILEKENGHKKFSTLSKKDKIGIFSGNDEQFRKDHHIPEHFTFKTAYFHNNEGINSANASILKPDTPNLTQRNVDSLWDFVEKKSYELSEIEDQLYDPRNAYMNMFEKNIGLYDLKEAMNNGENTNVETAKKLNKGITGFGIDRTKDSGEFRTHDGVFVNLNPNEEHDKELYVPSYAKDVPQQVETMFKELENDSDTIRGSANFIGKFIAAQPFTDGNKRTALFVASMHLNNRGYGHLIPNEKGWELLQPALDEVLIHKNCDKLREAIETMLKDDSYSFEQGIYEWY